MKPHVEDLQMELKELAELLNTSFEAPTIAQTNLIVELVILKMYKMAE